MASQTATQLEALLIDPWLPDLEVAEFLRDFHLEHPQVDLMMTDGAAVSESARSPYHQELLYALRRSQDEDTAVWRAAPILNEGIDPTRLSDLPSGNTRWSSPHLGEAAMQAGQTNSARNPASFAPGRAEEARLGRTPEPTPESGEIPRTWETASLEAPANGKTISSSPTRRETTAVERIPELIGNSPAMLEVSRRIRLVAAKSTPVLIEGPTGSGKELVAEALHRLSSRSRKPFVAINCAAIPEALLEAELFGHTRGAFTGAVQGRTGRIESADGGTLFLDEIGEMPLGLQSKLLRFFECGELQRIGDNENVKVDVRIISATHQPLVEDAQKGLFRADLYYRLAVFLIRTPALVEHMEDLPQLVGHFLERMGRKSPVKRVDSTAMAALCRHTWPGTVRELEHVLERAAILAGEEPVISAAEIDFGEFLMN
jgi:transcriptional regulator with AAA-type ATPase domain